MKTKSIVATTLILGVLGLMGSALVGGQANAQQYRRDSPYHRLDTNRRWYRSTVIPAGTAVNVRLDTKVSTENANPGDTWTGTVTQAVYANNGNYRYSYDRVGIPAGSPVQGVVTTAEQGTHDTRPELGLEIQRVKVNGRSYVMNADTEPIVAGTSRAKKVGAIAGGAAVGALLGHSVAKEHHGTLIGGLLGGLVGYGATRHAFRTLELQPGTELTFTTREDVLAQR